MATRYLLLRLSSSQLRLIRRQTFPATSFLSNVLLRHFSTRFSSLDDKLWHSRNTCTSTDVWNSELGDEVKDKEWLAKEDEIFRDIEGSVNIAKDILHSGRYDSGDMLSPEDEKKTLEKLLAYHPNREDKVGCGMDNIMVDVHPDHGMSRCLFVVRKDGSREDFSYWKCIRSYIEQKYPTDAERFISLHLTKSRKRRQLGPARATEEGGRGMVS